MASYDRVNRCVLVKGCRLTRMSDGHYALLRDLGPVNGVRGMKRHEIDIDFSWRALVEGFRRLTPVERSRQLPEYPIIADGRGQFPCVIAFCLNDLPDLFISLKIFAIDVRAFRTLLQQLDIGCGVRFAHPLANLFSSS